jgi:K+-sensing histidine kinase KdpD
MTFLLSRVEFRYGAALAAVGIAFLLRWLLDPSLGDHHPYSLFLFAVLLVAWYVGTGPAAVAFTFGALAANLQFVAPRHVLSVPSSGQQLGFFIFVIMGFAGLIGNCNQGGAGK